MTSQVARALDVLGTPKSVYVDWQSEAATEETLTTPSGGPIDLCRGLMGPKLFDYQDELVNKVQDSISGQRAGLMSLPTGGGKTRTAIAAALDSLRNSSDSRWLWVAPTVELLNQAAETFQSMWMRDFGAPDCRIVIQGEPDPDAFMWFNTPQSVNTATFPKASFDVVIFDEAHQLAAPTFRSAVARASSEHSSLIGLSATPGRSSDRETAFLVDYFEGNLIRSEVLGPNPVQALIDRGVLANLTFRNIVQDGINLPSDARLQAIGRLSRRLAANGRKVLSFTSSVADAIALSLHLEHLGVSASYVDSKLAGEERKFRLDRFESGEIQILFNQRLLATGYDCPAVSDVVLGSRIGSPVLFEQMVGRAARGPLTGGSSVARIWEFDDHLSIHGLPQSYYRFRDFEWQQA